MVIFDVSTDHTIQKIVFFLFCGSKNALIDFPPLVARYLLESY